MTNWQQQPQQTPQNWQMPQQPYPQQPAVLPGPGARDYLVRLTGFGESVPSSREAAALTAAGVVEPRVQGLLVWRRTLLIVITPLLLLAFILSAYQCTVSMGQDMSEFETGLGKFLEWLSPITLLALLVSALIVIGWWTETGRSTRILFWSWLVATVTPLVTALVPLSWQWDFTAMGAADFESSNGYRSESVEEIQGYADLYSGTLGMASVLAYSIGLLPVIVGLVSGVLRGARRTKSVFPSSIVPGWFVVIAGPFYSVILLTVFAIIAPMLGNALLAVGALILATAPLLNLLFMRSFTRPISRAEAAPLFYRSSFLSIGVSILGMVLLGIYLFTAEVHGVAVLGSSSASEEGTAWFSYLSLSQAGVGLVARYFFTTLVMAFLFARLVYRESHEITSMTPDVREELVEDMQGLRRFAGESAVTRAGAVSAPASSAPSVPWTIRQPDTTARPPQYPQ
ncbi:hypothetical protein ACTXKQ_04995 [Corynebacterium variabile]|uniref:hypothetical protein n=1 Tax=Corynebacterium variabile TaxID=1727 RepID=UPI003F8F01DC